MKLIESRKGREVYDVENGYTVVKEECSWLKRGFKIQVYTEMGNFLPSIYEDVDVLGNGEQPEEFKLEIMTTSYGALLPGDIERVIDGYKKALDTVKEIERVFMPQEKEVTA